MNKKSINNHEEVLKSPLTSLLVVDSEELYSYACEMDEFFKKELYLLNEQIHEIQQDIFYFHTVSMEFKAERCERKRHVMNAAKQMLSTKVLNFMDQEQMIHTALKLEGKILTREIETILRKYELL